MKRIIAGLLTIAMCLALFGCGTSQAEKALDKLPDILSIDPADYGLDMEALTKNGALPDFKALTLEALGAFFLHSDGAYSEGAGAELARRFLKDPEAVLDYLKRLGDTEIPISQDGKTARAADWISRAIAFDAPELDKEKFGAALDKLKELSQEDHSQEILGFIKEQAGKWAAD